MTTFELIEALSKRSKEEIEFAFCQLMKNSRIDFLSVQSAYVRYLEALKDRNSRRLVEAEVCIMESFIYDRIPVKNERAENSIQRRLYFLNTGGHFRMDELNEKYNYDEKRAKCYNHE